MTKDELRGRIRELEELVAALMQQTERWADELEEERNLVEALIARYRP
jgi:hypothetical protein